MTTKLVAFNLFEREIDGVKCGCPLAMAAVASGDPDLAVLVNTETFPSLPRRIGEKIGIDGGEMSLFANLFDTAARELQQSRGAYTGANCAVSEGDARRIVREIASHAMSHDVREVARWVERTLGWSS